MPFTTSEAWHFAVICQHDFFFPKEVHTAGLTPGAEAAGGAE